MTTPAAAGLGWLGIARLGLVQTALGAIIVLTTSTLNRVMVVELALPAMLPGILVGLHHAVQLLRPHLGYGSDVGGRRTPWIVGGMAVLAAGGVTASVATAWMATAPLAGVLLGVLAFLAIGVGVGATGTSLLVLLAKRVEPSRRPAAATIVWVMMIAGFAITATIAGKLLDPFSGTRLVLVTVGVAAVAFVVALLAIWGVEGAADAPRRTAAASEGWTLASFRQALDEVWREAQARRFTIFVFVSMLAFSAQDLILEPFAGAIFGFTPGETTQLSGLQHAGVMTGMILVAVCGSRFGTMRAWVTGGCIASACAIGSLALAGFVGAGFPLRTAVFLLGVSTGSFAVGAIGSMMMLAGEGRESREGLRMGLWGAAQAIAFAVGGFGGTVAVDLARWLLGSPMLAYAVVFGSEAMLFLVSAVMALRAVHPGDARRRRRASVIGVPAAVGEGSAT